MEHTTTEFTCKTNTERKKNKEKKNKTEKNDLVLHNNLTRQIKQKRSPCIHLFEDIAEIISMQLYLITESVVLYLFYEFCVNFQITLN